MRVILGQIFKNKSHENHKLYIWKQKTQPQTKNIFSQVTNEGLDKCKLYYIHTL